MLTGLAPVESVESEFTPSRSVALALLSAGTVITIQTRNTCYRVQVLDGSTRRVLITGGRLFPESTEVEVVGAADDEHVRVGWMIEGLQIELSTRRGPVLTSMVQSLSVDAETQARA
jgi:hypothetical protein